MDRDAGHGNAGQVKKIRQRKENEGQTGTDGNGTRGVVKKIL